MDTRTSTRTRRATAIASITVIVVVCLAADGVAQTADSMWQRGTVLAGTAGAAVASPDTRFVGGTALGWEIMPRLTVEGRALWLPATDEPSDFVALLSAAVPLTPGRRTVPFVSGGVGMYRATIDSASNEIPEFYARRMSAGVARPVFQDFLYSFSGGADVLATRHFTIKPEVSVLAVMANGDRRWIAVYAVNLAYHFEAHGIHGAIGPR
jgi:hypothetical protein